MAEISSQIIRVNEIEWSPMAPMVKAKVLWSESGHQAAGAIDSLRARRHLADASPCRRRTALCH